MKKKTAVDYIKYNIDKLNIIPTDKQEILISINDFNKLIIIAKEIEKDEIIDSVIYGNKEPLMADPKLLGENYYNEKFK